MLNKLIDFVLEQRAFVLLMGAALAVLGLRAANNLPIEAFPDVQDVQVIIVTQYPGQSSAEIERTVTLPIEREMSGVPRQTQLRSVTIFGLSIVTITFNDGTDDYFARQQVLEKLQNVNLPPGIQSSLAPLTTSAGEVFRYVVEAPASMPANEVRSLQDWVIRPNLKMVPGVADVVSFGGTIKEYQVQIDPYKLKRYGITIDQVGAAIGVNSSNVSGGVVLRGDEGLVIRGIALFTKPADIERVVLNASDGKTVLVSDVAKVVIGNRIRSGIVGFDSQDSVIAGIVQMTKGNNASKVVESLKEKISSIESRLPPGVKLRTIYDRTELINHTVMTVGENLLIGTFLVISILIVFLRNWRTAIIVATIIPMSLLFAFIVLDIRGVPANLISLGAVDFGIIIDGAVVLVEALMVRLSMQNNDIGDNESAFTWRLRTLKRTVVEMGDPIFFSQAIIITAFIPIFTFQRVEAKIFSPVALTLSFTMIGALILSLTLIPTFLALALEKSNIEEKHLEWMERFQGSYRNFLKFAMQSRAKILMCAIGLLTTTLILSPLLGSEFLPKLDEGNIWLTITLPTSSSIDNTKKIETSIRKIIQTYPETKHVISHVGRPDDGTDPKGLNNIEIFVDLKPRSEWRFNTKEELINNMNKKIHEIPGIPTNFSQVIQDNVEEALSGVKGEIAIKVFGPDLEILTDKADQIAKILEKIPGASDVAAIKIGGQSEIDVIVDREKISRLGINAGDVNSIIQTALEGSVVNTFYENDRRYDITVRLEADYRNSIDAISSVQIPLPGRNIGINLGDIADIRSMQGSARINREMGTRNSSVKANIIGRDQGGFVREAQAAVKKNIQLPPGYYITWGGQFENQQRAVKRLQFIIPITVLLIFSLLFWAFRSIRKALLVLLIIPFSMIGGIAGLALAGLHFSVSSAVGFIAVAGVSVQNGVIMVKRINEILLTEKVIIDGAIEGAVSRLRPIVMTALMACLGLLPSALSHGIGSETQRPFAVVIVGGILTATLVTLILLPLVFPYFQNKEITTDPFSK